MILYTKSNCNPCQKVKDYIKENNLNIQIIEDSEEAKLYSPTYPVLVDKYGFVKISDNIINYLKTKL